jgi:hypothetical protein
MNRLLAPILLLTLLFPALAQGGEVEFDDLVKRDGIYYKKFTDVPFTGKATGEEQGSVRNGKRIGPWIGYSEGKLQYKGTYKDSKRGGHWVVYYENGQLAFKGTYKDGNWDGPWVTYNKDGTVNKKNTGTYKNNVKIK